MLKGFILQEGRRSVLSEELRRLLHTVPYLDTDIDSVGVLIAYGSERFAVMLRA